MSIVSFLLADAPFISIPKGINKEIIKSLNPKNDSIIYDLGCGDGQILIEVSRFNPTVKCVGIEIGFIPYLLAKINTNKYRNIEIRRENIFKSNFGEATHIFLYLYADVIDKLLPKILNQCKKGTRLVSCDFKFSNLEPKEVIDIRGLSKNKDRGKYLFIYEI